MNTVDSYLPLIEGMCHPACRASVIIPARNEQHVLRQTLNALLHQVDPENKPLDRTSYEVIVLLNNCSDGSAEQVRSYQEEHPDFQFFYAERNLPPELAHVGTARRLLMDTAFARLSPNAHPHAAILSTDADTSVSPDWIYRNLEAIKQGAEVVGGAIYLQTRDIDLLDTGTLAAYQADRQYQRNVAHLESLLDPQPWDPWPRHLDHFGASLACTPAAYLRSGGLPPVKPLEDVAFIDALLRVDARIRHDPAVRVFTSARLNGRAEIGLSGQLRIWQEEMAVGLPQMGESAEYLAHRFSCMSKLRHLGSSKCLPPLDAFPHCWHQPVQEMHPLGLTPAAFLSAIDCNRLVNETFHGRRHQELGKVNREIHLMVLRLQSERAIRFSPEDRADTFPSEASGQYATQDG